MAKEIFACGMSDNTVQFAWGHGDGQPTRESYAIAEIERAFGETPSPVISCYDAPHTWKKDGVQTAWADRLPEGVTNEDYEVFEGSIQAKPE